MKAVFCTKYGPPNVLKVKQTVTPTPKKDEILVRVMATSVNSGDVRVRSFKVPCYLKPIMLLKMGFRGPRKGVLGNVFAGVVEEVGDNTSRFKVGDRVFGMTGFDFGTYAEYLKIKDKGTVEKMPSRCTFEEAASLPFGWHTAIYFLLKAGIERYEKQKVLIYGATGSVGCAAIQLAKCCNAEVTAICSTKGENLAQKLGADHIISYNTEDFTATHQRYDIIFDAVGKTSRSKCRHLLNKNGKYVTVGGLDMAKIKNIHLEIIADLFEEGNCKAIIDKIFTMDEVAEAHRYVDTGRKKGDVVMII